MNKLSGGERNLLRYYAETERILRGAERGAAHQHLLRIGYLPIRKHLTDKTAFGPVAIEAMSKAFEEACIALQVYAGDEKGREIIATRIIDLARSGLIDPVALRDRVIAEARLSE